MRRPVIVWVDDDTEEILVEEYVSVLDGELGSSTHMELTNDQIVPVPPDDQLTRDVEDAVAACYAAAHAAHHRGDEDDEDDWAGIARRLRAHFRLGEEGAEGDEDKWAGISRRLRAAFHLDEEGDE